MLTCGDGQPGRGNPAGLSSCDAPAESPRGRGGVASRPHLPVPSSRTRSGALSSFRTLYFIINSAPRGFRTARVKIYKLRTAGRPVRHGTRHLITKGRSHPCSSTGDVPSTARHQSVPRTGVLSTFSGIAA